MTAYQRHSETSREAAAAIEPRAGTLRAQVLAFIRSADVGATDEEIQIGTKLNANTERPRRVELLQAGLIKNSGLVRRTTSGRNAVIWMVPVSTRKQQELF